MFLELLRPTDLVSIKFRKILATISSSIFSCVLLCLSFRSSIRSVELLEGVSQLTDVLFTCRNFFLIEFQFV